MGKTRTALVATVFTASALFSSASFAIGSEGDCLAADGITMDLQGVKHCMAPIIAEEFHGEEYSELKGVKACKFTVRKTSIGDYCLIPLEAKPAKAAMVTPAADVVASAIETPALDPMAAPAAAEAPKKKCGLFGCRKDKE